MNRLHANPLIPPKVNSFGKYSVKFGFRLAFWDCLEMLSAPQTGNSVMAFAGNPLNRLANSRQDAGLIAQFRAHKHAFCARFSGDKIATHNGEAEVTRGPVGDDTLFLGVDAEGLPWFAGRSTSEEALTDLRSLALAGTTANETLGILAQARSLLHWHERHGFCANCGAATVMADAGYRRHCQTCQADHFPRTDPVVIIAVRHGRELLLGRQAAWQPGMFSTLAGFMEPGETIENAARREVFEEAGIVVGAARVVANQPWPFPSSLMIGLVGEALSRDITIDPKEIDEARWFDADEIRLMNAKQHPDNLYTPPAIAIAHRLIVAALADV